MIKLNSTTWNYRLLKSPIHLRDQLKNSKYDKYHLNDIKILKTDLNSELLSNIFRSTISSIINDLTKKRIVKREETLDITEVPACYLNNIGANIYAQFPQFFKDENVIRIPTKVLSALKYTPRKLLREIHEDMDVAVELCLLFLTNLNSTYFKIIDESAPDGWKSLRAQFLSEFLRIKSGTYVKVVKALEYSLKNGAIIDCDHIYIVGEKNFWYRLGEAFIGKGIVDYKLKTYIAQKLLQKNNLRLLRNSLANPIVANLIKLYPNITLPTLDEINKEADRLISEKYVSKKGKKLAKLNKHKRSKRKISEDISYVEDSISIYKYLTDNGLMIPRIGDQRSGGRVVDSFTLMPSWIRKLVKINGESFCEIDYSCMHPNIAVKVYGGTTHNLAHDNIADVLGINPKIVKIEHLSFFNKKIWQMKESQLYNYYNEHEPIMLTAIIKEKNESNYKHKITSRKLFEIEVEVMTDVIMRLNSENIYVGYVYDALFCRPSDAAKVKEVMNATIRDHGIMTTAKISE